MMNTDRGISMADPKLTILLADDSKSIQSALGRALECSFDVRVIVAETFAKASAVLDGEGQELFLAILDLALPDAMNGEVVDHALRLGVPSLVFTSTFDDALRNNLLDKGVLDYVVKGSRAVEEVVRLVGRLQANRARKILVVDDSVSARSSICSSLTAFGFQILAAGSGEQALEALASQDGIDLVITDFEMPGMDGVQLTQIIRKVHSRDEVAVIGVSSAATGGLAARFLKHGATDFLLKPFGREELYCRVLSIIEGLEQNRRAKSFARRRRDFEEQQRRLIEHAPIGVFRSTPSGQFLLVNTRLAEMYGYGSAQELMEEMQDIGAQLYVDAAEREMVRSELERGPVDGLEIRRRRKDGTVIWVSLSMRPVYDDQGSLAYYEGFSLDITHKKRTEQALRASVDTQRAIMDSVDAGIILIDPDTHTIQAINTTAASLFGAPAEGIIGKVCHQYLCPAEAGGCPVTDYAQNIERSERALVKADGSRLSILKTVKTIMLNGRLFLLESFMDITDRKKAEQQLALERERLANIIEGTGVGTWEWNVQTGELALNDRWAQIVGYALDELAPVSVRTWEALVHPEDLQRSSQMLERHFTGEFEGYECECRMRHKQGGWVWVLARGKLLSRTPDGSPLMMFGTHLDITERKKEQELLLESEERYRSFFHSTEAVRLLIDPRTGLIVEANRAAERYYKYPLGTLKGRSISEINTLPPEKLMAELGRAATLKKGHFSFQHMLGDGTVREVEVYTSVVRLEGRNLVMSSVHDVTERKHLERVKRDVEHIMRHDLKSPLTGFIAIPPLLLEGDNLTADQREMLALLGVSGKRMLGQINASLELFRIEEGRYVPKVSECWPMALAQDVIGIFTLSRRLPKSVFRLSDRTGDSGHGGRSLRTDPQLLEIVLTNLIGNALDAGGPTDQVTIETSETAQEYILAISNSQAVPEQIRDRFFEKYATAGKTGGTGIGTYSAAVMVRALGGRIEMRTSEAEGTTVTVAIPLERKPDAGTQKEPAGPSPL